MASATVAALFASMLVYGVQKLESMLIYPSNIPEGSRSNVDTPDKYNLPYDHVRIKTADNERLQTYILTHDPSSPEYKNLTIVMFAPNAGNIGHTLPIVEAIYSKLGYNVVSFSYRGYGLSSGSPSEKGLKLDAQTVLHYLADHPVIKDSKLILYGRSLGGAVAIHTATLPVAHNFVAGIILENTFLSIPKLMPTVVPFLKPFKFLVSQKWESEKLILGIPKDLHLLFFSGAADDLVPPEQHKQLFDLAPSKHKFFKSLISGTHNDTVMQDGYWSSFNRFCVICETGGSLDCLDDDGLDGNYENIVDLESAAVAVTKGMPEEMRALLTADDLVMGSSSGQQMSWIPVTDVDAVKSASITNIKDVL